MNSSSKVKINGKFNVKGRRVKKEQSVFRIYGLFCIFIFLMLIRGRGKKLNYTDFFFFFFVLNSLAYARVTQHCALSRSPQPNTTNYFLREEAACRRATPPGVPGRGLLWRYGGGRRGAELRARSLGRSLHHPTCHFHMSSPPEREPRAVWQVRAVNVAGRGPVAEPEERSPVQLLAGSLPLLKPLI